MNPVHRALREGTAAAHERVDAAFAAFDLTDRASYARFLSAHAEVLLPIEATLPAERIVADWAERKRGPLLREDLAMLGTDRPPALPEAPDGSLSDAQIAGILYVVEGSRLGGKFLARQLPPGFPRAYLASDQPAEKWRNLLDKLAQILYEPAALQSALTAAHHSFAAFERAATRWSRD